MAGFTLIELMIGVIIGLLASLAVTHVLVNSEGQKRTTTSGSDAQVNGALALTTLQRAVQPAGYGFAATPGVIGCALSATYNATPMTTALPAFPTSLVPVVITDGAAGAPDTIRVLSSGKGSFSIPLRVVAGGTVSGTEFKLPVSSVRGLEQGDLVVAAVSATPSVACEMFQVSHNPGATPEVSRDSSYGRWNNSALANSYASGAILVNMGSIADSTYSIGNTASLMVRSLSIDTTSATASATYTTTELYPNIVQLQALYGKDTNGDGNVDSWDNVTPTSNTGWRQLVAVRIAVVARSAQFEREDVTFGNLQWDVGTGTVAGSATCGTSKCLAIKIDNLPDWKRYRYKLYDTVVPLRNMLWNS